jgi:Family of unknown function (DUF6174)
MMRKTIFLCGLVLLAGCSSGVSLTGFEEKLAQSRASWKAQNLRSYTFTLQRVCFCPEEYTRPVTITVREGVATNAPEHLAAYGTIDKILDTVEAAYTDKAEQLDVTYAPDGWPKTVYIDRSKQIADEEYSLTITDVRPL